MDSVITVAGWVFILSLAISGIWLLTALMLNKKVEPDVDDHIWDLIADKLHESAQGLEYKYQVQQQFIALLAEDLKNKNIPTTGRLVYLIDKAKKGNL